ncbi:MAG: PEGA domain-containing protein [Deltaproteobacteria bacterium]|nr:PEGA domain-containing protein [Deltaproteobacteria bacterium]
MCKVSLQGSNKSDAVVANQRHPRERLPHNSLSIDSIYKVVPSVIKWVLFSLFALIIAAVSIDSTYAQHRLAKLKLLGGIPGAEVRINGEAVGTLPMMHAVTVEPGVVRLEVEAKGYRLYTNDLTVGSGNRVRVRVELQSSAQTSQNNVAPLDAPLDAPLTPLASAASVTPSSSSSTSAASERGSVSASAPLRNSNESAFTGREPIELPQTNKKTPATPAASRANEPSTTRVSGSALNPQASLFARPNQASYSPSPTGDEAKRANETNTSNRPQPSAGSQPVTTGPLLGLDNDAERNYVDEVEGDEERDIFDPLLFELFTGYSYLLLALGTRAIPDSEQISNLTEQEARQLAASEIGDWVDITRGGGVTLGTAASLRIDFISFGARLSYSSYGQADVLVLTGEIAQRIQGSIVEFYAGFGFGGGWLYRIPSERITANSGLALRFGLGLGFFVARGWTLGIGVDATGLFLGGEGVSPSQVGDISLTEANHPVGLQVPLTINLSPRL